MCLRLPVSALTMGLVCSGLVVGQTAAFGGKPTPTTGIFYVESQLTINLTNTSLGEVLTRLSSLTGVKIDIPPEANSLRLPAIKLGPGSPREVVASLLRELHFNYIVQEADADPTKLRSILVLPEEKNETVEASPEMMRAARAGRFANPSEPMPGREVVSPAVDPVDASQGPAASAPGADNTAPPPAVPEVPSTLAPSSIAAGSRPGALSPPPVLNQSAITQQLQQMYQQRAQMIQQNRQSGGSQ